MFIFTGTLNTVNGWSASSADYLGLATTLRNHPLIALQVAPDVASTGVSFDTKSLSTFFTLIDTVKVPMFAVIHITPSALRSSATNAVSNGQLQMSDIMYYFTQYGLPSLLRGFCFVNYSSYQTYSDGSRMERSQLNTLVTTAHDTHGKAAMVVAADGEDAVLRSAARSSRATTAAAVVAASTLGLNTWFQDVLVHLHPIYPIHLEAVAEGTAPIVDWARLQSILALAKTSTSASLIHAVVQGPHRDWSTDNLYVGSDGFHGLTVRQDALRTLRNARQALNAAGFVHIGLSVDSTLGALSNYALDVNAANLFTGYPVNAATDNAPTWGTLSPVGSKATISFPLGTATRSITFDSAANPESFV